MLKKTCCLTCFLLLWLETSGCGNMLDPANSGTPLWSIQCRLKDSDDLPAPSSLRVAFLWNLASSDKAVTIGDHGEIVLAGIAKVAQDVSIVPEFPSQFLVELYDLPPRQSFHSGEQYKQDWAGIEVAYGELIVYDDRNGNDKLDLLPVDAQEVVDVVIGPQEDYAFMLVEEDTQNILADEDSLSPGLNVFLPPGFLKDDQGRPTMPFEDWLKAPVLDITLLEDPARQYLMCEEPVEYIIDSSLPGKILRCQPVPEDVEVVCSEDGRLYEALYTACRQASVCSPIRCERFLDLCPLAPDDPIPSDWPCEVN